MSVSLDELEQALEDIKEWFVERGSPATVENLDAGVDREAFERCCRALSIEVLEPLAWLYGKHDGQPDLELYPLFEWLTFLPLEYVGDALNDLLYCYFGCDGRWGTVNPAAIYDDKRLREEEKDTKWFPFANQGFDFLAAHTKTGRVIRVLKGDLPAITVIADSVGEFLMQYASDLWDDLYVLSGDPELEGVVQEGFISLGAYAGVED